MKKYRYFLSAVAKAMADAEDDKVADKMLYYLVLNYLISIKF